VSVHHRGVSDTFTFSVSAVDHSTGIAITSYPTKVEPKQSFEVEIAVICLDAGCDLMGKTIQVKDPSMIVKGTGTLTTKAFNARYGKYEYRGKVKVTAPDKVGTYEWWGIFPYQSRHKEARVRF